MKKSYPKLKTYKLKEKIKINKQWESMLIAPLLFPNLKNTGISIDLEKATKIL